MISKIDVSQKVICAQTGRLVLVVGVSALAWILSGATSAIGYVRSFTQA